MATEYKIEIKKREDLSIQSLKKLRRDGNIPGIYYSSTSKDSIPIIITKKDYAEAVKSGARIFNISMGGGKQNVLFKSVQYHPVTEEVLHLDLYGVRMDQAISIKIPLQLLGDAIGVKEEGGILNQPLNEIEIQCLPAEIPDFIELNISEVGMGQSLNAGDIILDEKFTLITSMDAVVLSVTQPMKEIEVIEELAEDFLEEEGALTDGEEAQGDEKSEAANKTEENNEAGSE